MRAILLALLCVAAPVLAQERPPILDMHVHALAADFSGPPPTSHCVPWPEFPSWDQRGPYGATLGEWQKNPPCEDPVWSPETTEGIMHETIEIMERYNVHGVVNGPEELVEQWMQAAPERFYPGLFFELGHPQRGYSLERVKQLHEQGRLAVFGEISNQYAGIEPSDPRMDPYWQFAQEQDIPVAVHIGTGPPGATYLGWGNYRAHLHSALTMEEVLVKYPKLRVYIMHAGYPMLDDLLAVLYVHPQVYVDVGVIDWILPREEFYRYLKTIMEAGYGNRVMFGSDQMIWPGVMERAIQVIEEAPFLSEQQKRDIFYNNAARFLRLSDEEVRRHHGQ